MKITLPQTDKNGRMLVNLSVMHGLPVNDEVKPFVEEDPWIQTLNHIKDNNFNTRVYIPNNVYLEKIILEACNHFKKIVISLTSPFSPYQLLKMSGIKEVKEFSDNNSLEVLIDHSFKKVGDLLITNSSNLYSGGSKYSHHPNVLEIPSFFSLQSDRELRGIRIGNHKNINNFWYKTHPKMPSGLGNLQINDVEKFTAFLALAGQSAHLIKDHIDSLPIVPTKHDLHGGTGTTTEKFLKVSEHPLRKAEVQVAARTILNSFKTLVGMGVEIEHDRFISARSLEEIMDAVRSRYTSTSVIISSGYLGLPDWNYVERLLRNEMVKELFIFCGQYELEHLSSLS